MFQASQPPHEIVPDVTLLYLNSAFSNINSHSRDNNYLLCTAAGWWELRGAVPGLGHQRDVLRSPLAVLAHQQSEGKIVAGAVLGRRKRESFCILRDLHLHILQGGVVHHHKALLTGRTKSFNSYFTFYFQDIFLIGQNWVHWFRSQKLCHFKWPSLLNTHTHSSHIPCLSANSIS